MLGMDRVCIHRSSDRDRAEALAEELRRAGIDCAFLPSYRALAQWDIEVESDHVGVARVIVEGVLTS